MDIFSQLWDTVKTEYGAIKDMTFDQITREMQHKRTIEMLKFQQDMETSNYSPNVGQPAVSSTPDVNWNANASKNISLGSLGEISPVMLAMVAGGGILLLKRK